jgi:two-component system response regulator YesN
MHPQSDGDTRSGEGRPRILILDPDPRIAEALALALRGRAQVEWATSGMAGLLLAAEREVDLVITHAHLPDMCPADFLRLFHLLRPGVSIGLLGTDQPPEGSLGPKVDIYFPEPIQLKRLLRWIADCLDQPASSSPGVASPPVRYEIPVQHLEIVRWVLEFIDRSYQDGTPLSRIAQAAGVSRSHLCRVFKRVTGLSLKRFLTRRRLQAAKELLQEPGATIDRVARRVGYRDASHFDRVFRQWEGRTPSGYRRQVNLRAFRNGVPATRNGRLALGSPPPA